MWNTRFPIQSPRACFGGKLTVIWMTIAILLSSEIIRLSEWAFFLLIGKIWVHGGCWIQALV